jgi:Domain of unknown function (DUF6250)
MILRCWSALFLLIASLAAADGSSPDPRFRTGARLAQDDFKHGLGLWSVELERGGTVRALAGELSIDVPAGCTVWFKQKLDGPLLIEYEATVIGRGGPNDRVSDLNSFWMARDTRSPEDLFETIRGGAFADYDFLKCYYVGLGGNGNTTTRFRRYVGEPGNRPLRAEHDLITADVLLKANVPQKVQLLAAGQHVAYYRDERRLFELEDPDPYTSGWFALRTTKNHMTVRHFRVYSLHAAAAPKHSR